MSTDQEYLLEAATADLSARVMEEEGVSLKDALRSSMVLLFTKSCKMSRQVSIAKAQPISTTCFARSDAADMRVWYNAQNLLGGKCFVRYTAKAVIAL